MQISLPLVEHHALETILRACQTVSALEESGQQITFPTCWDGTNVDSPDHQSHVAYATIPFEPYADPVINYPGNLTDRGKCPDSHPVHLPQVMYEVMWDTPPYNQKEFWNEVAANLSSMLRAMRECIPLIC